MTSNYKKLDAYLIVYEIDNGIAQLENVGMFIAYSESEAIYDAQKEWNTTAELWAMPIAKLNNKWSYYI